MNKKDQVNAVHEAKTYSRPLNYTSDQGVNRGQGGFYFVFNEAGLNCNFGAQRGDQMCIASPGKRNGYKVKRPKFVYMDCGAWADGADPERNKPCRDFGLVCGPHVYLCEFTRQKTTAKSDHPIVNEFIQEMAKKGCGVQIRQYACAEPAGEANLASSQSLYIFLGDLHAPPVTWFHTRMELAVMAPFMTREPPPWLSDCGAFQRQKDFLYRNYYSAAQCRRESHRRPQHESDIFGSAGDDLIAFLDGLSGLPPACKSRIHFIQLGDLMELWLGRDYQYESAGYEPKWKNSGSINLVSDWALEVMIQNTPIFEAFRRIAKAGLAEVKYLWGNHDAYLKNHYVITQLGGSMRDPVYVGLKDLLIAEHGHRFDRSNFDNTGYYFSGPQAAKWVYYVPVIRSLEKLARANPFHPSERDCYLLGATLIFLHQLYDMQRTPFCIYVQAHTHHADLIYFLIKTEYHLYAQP